MSTRLTLLPLPVRRIALPNGEVAVADLATVARPAGPTAVFVHGFTGSKEDFALLAAPVTAAGHRYVAYDQRGHHESPGPDDRTAYAVDALAAHLLELVTALGGPVHLVGHSFGGLVARAATIREPRAVASLTLLDSGPAALSGPRVERMEALRPLLEAYGRDRLVDALLLAAAVDPSRRPPGPDVVDFLRRRFLASTLAGLLGTGDAILGEPDRTDALRATGVPVLVACGEHDDTWTPEVQRAMADRLGAPYVEIADAVHSPAAEQPEPTAAVLVRFWRSAGLATVS